MPVQLAPILADDIGSHIGEHTYIGGTPANGALISGVLHLDTLIATLVVMAIMIGLALYLRPRLTSGVPGPLQNALEVMVEFVLNTATDLIGDARARVIGPLAVTLGFFILISNWLGLLPTARIGIKDFHLNSPTSDMNTTFALSLIVILYVHYSSVRARGGWTYLKSWLKPPMNLLTIIEEIPKPVTLSLRLFGNIAAGEILLVLLAALPYTGLLAPIPDVIWIAFSLFIGGVQAFVFVMLTIAYYGIATETAGH